MKKVATAHPVLFALYPILALYAHNISELRINVILMPVFVVLMLTLLLWGLMQAIFRDEKLASILVSLYLIFFFAYGHFFDALVSIPAFKFFFGNELYILATWTMLTVAAGYIVLRVTLSLSSTAGATRIFALIGSVLVLMPIVQIGAYKLRARPLLQDVSTLEIEEGVLLKESGDGSTKPDIYYIIFDRYANARTLKEYYNYDNSEFIQSLTEKGFFVADRSLANYPTTDLSLASSLNMEFLDALSKSVGEEMTDYDPIREKVRSHVVWRFLKKWGYTYIHMGSTWGLTSKNANADANYSFSHPLSIPEFSLKLVETTMLYPIISEPITFWGKEITKPLSVELLARETTLDQLDKIRKIPRNDSPKFVFAHVLLPHEPYVFGRDGRFVPRGEPVEQKRRELYLNQLIYGNTLIENMVEGILENTEGQAVIILQADEGPFPPRYKENELWFSWKEATVDELREKFGILNAYYLPNVDKSALYDSITPVNTFRLVFNLYFDAGLEMLPDKIYGIRAKAYPYKQINVTDKIKYR